MHALLLRDVRSAEALTLYTIIDSRRYLFHPNDHGKLSRVFNIRRKEQESELIIILVCIVNQWILRSPTLYLCVVRARCEHQHNK